MVLSKVLKRLEALQYIKTEDPFPERGSIADLNRARTVWGVPLIEQTPLSNEEAFERGRKFMASLLLTEIEKIKRDIANGI